MGSVLRDIGDAYQEGIVDAGKEAELFALLAFLLSFGFIRLSTHMIRAQVKWWPGNVQVGGTHVHHLVWGILLMLIMGYTAISFEPESPWREVVAVFFGIGMGLTLDEFALWLNLKDVYWSREGRESIDAVVVTAGLGLVAIVGYQAWIEFADGVATAVRALVGTYGVLTLGIAVVNALKGKLGMALLTLVVPVVGLVGAFRLARPHSLWSRMYGGERRARAEQRFARAS